MFENLPFSTIMLLNLFYVAFSVIGMINTLTPVLAKKYVGFKFILINSIVMQSIGLYIISLSEFSWTHLGFAIYSLGFGMAVTTITIYIDRTLRAAKKDKHTVKLIFTWDVLVFNLGLFVGAIFGLHVIDIAPLFTLAFVFSATTLILLILCEKLLIMGRKISYGDNLTRYTQFYSICIGVVALIYIAFHFTWLIDVLVIGIAIKLVIEFRNYLKQRQGEEKVNLLTFLIYQLSACVYWGCYASIPLLSLYLITFHSNSIIFGYKVNLSPEWIGIINTGVTAFFTVFLLWVLKRYKIQYYISFQLSLGLMVISCAIMICAILMAVGKYLDLSLIMVFIAFVALSEVLMHPLNYTIIEQLTPEVDSGLFYGGTSFMNKSFSMVVVAMVIGVTVLNVNQAYALDNALYLFIAMVFILLLNMLLLALFVKRKII
ncbi:MULTISPECIES: MFS transporter [Cysteiniphilum]|nr:MULTISPECIES: hypothetical protein [Cysteiniphilum]